jgi:hypothetical protein
MGAVMGRGTEPGEAGWFVGAGADAPVEPPVAGAVPDPDPPTALPEVPPPAAPPPAAPPPDDEPPDEPPDWAKAAPASRTAAAAIDNAR